MQTTLRILFGCLGRSLCVLLIVAATWFYWWVWPERPLKEWYFEQHNKDRGRMAPQLAANGATVLYCDVTGDAMFQPAWELRNRIPFDRVRLMSLEDGRNLLPDEYAFESHLLVGGRLVAVTFKDFRIGVFDAVTGHRGHAMRPSDQDVTTTSKPL